MVNIHWPPPGSPRYCAKHTYGSVESLLYRHSVDFDERDKPLLWECKKCGKLVIGNNGPEGGFVVPDYVIQEAPG